MIAGRNMIEAIERVMEMSDDEIRLFAKHDPDIFRGIARAAALREDTAARIYPANSGATLSTRFDFSCAQWEKP